MRWSIAAYVAWVAAGPSTALAGPAEECAWPLVVAVDGGQCTGLLLGPTLVIYPGECGVDVQSVQFGEDALGGLSVATPVCQRSPATTGHDLAYCQIEAWLDDIPTAPPLFGCELDAIDVGTPVVIVGFAAGSKYWAESTIAAVDGVNGRVSIKAPVLDGGACLGHAGAVALTQMQDSSWRTLAIATTAAQACGDGELHSYSLLAPSLAWLESQTHADLTPCHLLDGSWAPAPECAGAFAQPLGEGSGTWVDWCGGTLRSGKSSTCGPAWDGFDPTLPPGVTIVQPSDGDVFANGDPIVVEVEAAKDPWGFAIRDVRLTMSSKSEEADWSDTSTTPFRYSFESERPWRDEEVEIVAHVEDWSGRVTDTEPVTITVGTPPEHIFASPDQGVPPCTVVTDRPAQWGWLVALFVLGLSRYCGLISRSRPPGYQ